MNHWLRLGLPLALGAVAAVLSWSASVSRMTPLFCVRVLKDIQHGEVFGEDDLGRIEISGDLQSLPESAIPWEDRSVLYGRPTMRALKNGDLVLWRDATPKPKELPAREGEVLMSVSLASMTVVPDFIRVGQQVGFLISQDSYSSRDSADTARSTDRARAKSEHVGPFRVLAVGKRVTPTETGDRDRGDDERILTVPARFLPNTQQLDDQSDRLLAALAGSSGERILGVVLHSNLDNGAAAHRN